MKLISTSRKLDANAIPSAADWYTIVAAVAVVVFGVFTLLVVCAFRCYRHRTTNATRDRDVNSMESGSRSANNSATSSKNSTVIMTAPFVQPDVEYCSPQYDLTHPCPGGFENATGNSGSAGGGQRACKSTNGSGENNRCNITRQGYQVSNEEVERSVDTSPDIVLEISTAHSLASLTSFTSSSTDKSTDCENDAASSGSPSGTPISGDESSGNDVCLESDLNGNENGTPERNNNKGVNEDENDISSVKQFTNLNKIIRRGGPDVKQPVIHFSVTYDRSRATLMVSVSEIVNISPSCANKPNYVHVTPMTPHWATSPADDGGRTGRLEPYVRLGLLLPDGRRFKAKTRVVRASTSSTSNRTGRMMLKADFGETFAFRGVEPVQLLGGGRLHLAALAFDRFSRDSIIGESIISFDEQDFAQLIGGSASDGLHAASGDGTSGNSWVASDTATLTVNRRLIPNKMQSSAGTMTSARPSSTTVGLAGGGSGGKQRGELLVSVGFQPGAVNRLSIVVLKARNLPSYADCAGAQFSTISDFYVKIYILRNGRPTDRKQSRVVRGSASTRTTVFNEAFYFDLPPSLLHHHHYGRGSPDVGTGRQSQLADAYVEILLLDWNRSSKEDIIGRLKIGPLWQPSSSSTPTPTISTSSPDPVSSTYGGECKTSFIGTDERTDGQFPEKSQSKTSSQNESATSLVLNAIGHDRQVAVWYKLVD